MSKRIVKMGKKNLALFGLFLIAGLLIVSSASAEIIISQPKALYNLGDDFSVEVKADSAEPGYMDINLVCSEGGQASIYHNVPDGKIINVKRKLTPAYIGNLSGNCRIAANYGGESQNSQSFKISNSINIFLNLNSISYDVGSSITLKGTAEKENGQLVGSGSSAFITASLTEDISSSDIVKDGQFTVNFEAPETTHAGDYTLIVKVYDKDERGNILNSGSKNIEFKVIQKPAKIDIAFDKKTLVPGENLSLIPFLYDKAGDLMSGKILVKIVDSKSNSLYEGYIPINENLVLNTATTTLPGYARIIAQSGNITYENTIEVAELKRISIEIKNQTLSIANIGNVIYKDIIDIGIGGSKILKEIELGLGEKREYALSAPNGEYEVTVKDKSSFFSRAGVPITGSAIGADEINSGVDGLIYKYSIMWIFIILLLGFALFAWYKKRGGVSFYFSPSQKEKVAKAKAESKKGGVEIVDHRAIAEKARMGEIRKAEQVLVLHGQKQPASIVAIKIKNDVSGAAKQNLTNALEHAYKLKGVSYASGNNILLIFSPLITKTFKNEHNAIKAAMDIQKELNEHNKRFKDKIFFGIGVNSGEIINKLEDSMLKFTSIGKTMGIAKKIADSSNGEVLLSKDIHEKTMNAVKTDKSAEAEGGLDTFKIKRVVNSEESRKFIQEFLRRNAIK